jgi:hypothetical protein
LKKWFVSLALLCALTSVSTAMAQPTSSKDLDAQFEAMKAEAVKPVPTAIPIYLYLAMTDKNPKDPEFVAFYIDYMTNPYPSKNILGNDPAWSKCPEIVTESKKEGLTPLELNQKIMDYEVENTNAEQLAWSKANQWAKMTQEEYNQFIMDQETRIAQDKLAGELKSIQGDINVQAGRTKQAIQGAGQDFRNRMILMPR